MNRRDFMRAIGLGFLVAPAAVEVARASAEPESRVIATGPDYRDLPPLRVDMRVAPPAPDELFGPPVVDGIELPPGWRVATFNIAQGTWWGGLYAIAKYGDADWRVDRYGSKRPCATVLDALMLCYGFEKQDGAFVLNGARFESLLPQGAGRGAAWWADVAKALGKTPREIYRAES